MNSMQRDEPPHEEEASQPESSSPLMQGEKEEREEQKITFSFPTFSFSNVARWVKRQEIAVWPKEYMMISALYDMRELLMHIEDYALIKKLGNTDKGGLYELSQAVQTAIPRYYDNHSPESVEQYKTYLGKLEMLTRDWVLKHDRSLIQQYPFDPVVDRYTQDVQVHDHAVMLYAMAIAALSSSEVADMAYTLLEYFLYYRVGSFSYDTPTGLNWVRNQVYSYTHLRYPSLSSHPHTAFPSSASL